MEEALRVRQAGCPQLAIGLQILVNGSNFVAVIVDITDELTFGAMRGVYV